MLGKSCRRVCAAAALICALCASRASAQAWVPAPHTGAVFLDYQRTNVNYHYFSQDVTAFGGEGTKADLGEINANTIQVAGDYSFFRNFAFSASLAYVTSQYQGAYAEDPVIDDGDFHGTFQDVTLNARYMLPWKGFAITPNAGFTFPTHDYEHHGHAAVGKGNSSFNAGIALGRTLGPLVSNVWVQGGYTHEFVRDVEEWGLDVNEYNASVGWYPVQSVGLSGYFIYHETEDGIDWYWDDFTQPDVEEHHDMAANTLFRRVGGTAGYQFNASTGVFADVSAIVSGSNTHDGLAFTFGTTWNFLGPGSR